MNEMYHSNDIAVLQACPDKYANVVYLNYAHKQLATKSWHDELQHFRAKTSLVERLCEVRASTKVANQKSS